MVKVAIGSSRCSDQCRPNANNAVNDILRAFDLLPEGWKIPIQLAIFMVICMIADSMSFPVNSFYHFRLPLHLLSQHKKVAFTPASRKISSTSGVCLPGPSSKLR